MDHHMLIVIGDISAGAAIKILKDFPENSLIRFQHLTPSNGQATQPAPRKSAPRKSPPSLGRSKTAPEYVLGRLGFGPLTRADLVTAKPSHISVASIDAALYNMKKGKKVKRDAAGQYSARG